MDTTVETFECAGLTVRIGWEEDSSPFNPRGECNLGTMVCWHPDYILGDEQISANRGAVDRDKNGSARSMFQSEKGGTELRSMEHLERYLTLMRGALVTIPLYLLDHSGISMSAGAPSIGDTPMGGRDHHGNARMWDTTMVGYIYTTAERVAELCGAADYKPSDFEGTQGQWLAEQLRYEVSEYDSYLTGDVYGYVITDDTGDERDSCWGLIGYKAAMEEMTMALKAEAKDRKAERRMEKAERSGLHVDVFPAR